MARTTQILPAPPTTTRKITLTVLGILGAALVLFGISGYLWWTNIYTDPRNVFQAMLANSLQLNGVSREIDQTGNGQKIRQVTYAHFGSEPRAISRTTVRQENDPSTVVVTESIGTPTKDYNRYTSIKTGQKNASGNELNFDKVVNVWGSDEAIEAGPTTDGELYNEAVLGVVPFGMLNQRDRHELLAMMANENTYEIDFASHIRKKINGRTHYIYEVSVDPVAYIKVLKRFGEMNGLNHLAQLDPANYDNGTRLPFTLTVDAWSRQLKKIEYQGGARTEVLSGHNAVKDIPLPQDVISNQELQGRLQQLQ